MISIDYINYELDLATDLVQINIDVKEEWKKQALNRATYRVLTTAKEMFKKQAERRGK